MKIGDKVDHDEILELLPWFVNDSLSEKDRARVIEHLRECAICVNERDQLQRLQGLVTSEDFDPPEYRFSFQKLMVRIDAAEQSKDEIAAKQSVNRSADMKWPIFALAASLVVGVIFISAVWQSPSDSAERTDKFRTLLTTKNAPSGTVQRVELIFTQPIKADTQRAALIETNSYLVSGPDENGRYIVEVRIPEDMSDAEFISSLRAIDGVEYAAFSQARTDRPR